MSLIMHYSLCLLCCAWAVTTAMVPQSLWCMVSMKSNQCSKCCGNEPMRPRDCKRDSRGSKTDKVWDREQCLLSHELFSSCYVEELLCIFRIRCDARADEIHFPGCDDDGPRNAV